MLMRQSIGMRLAKAGLDALPSRGAQHDFNGIENFRQAGLAKIMGVRPALREDKGGNTTMGELSEVRTIKMMGAAICTARRLGYVLVSRLS